MSTFTANGKLLLTGEYLVLKGALALALPTKIGQTLTIQPYAALRHCEGGTTEATQPDPKLLYWTAHHPSGPWFSATLSPDTLEVLTTDSPAKAEKLSHILKAVRELNPKAFESGLRFESHLGFDPAWGLGSSSTLLSLLAQWAEVNPYELLRNTFGGSGYDIACATAIQPIYYQLVDGHPQSCPAPFQPPFADRLFFVYQGKKQHSSDEVKAFNKHWDQADLTTELMTISELSRALPSITYFEDFCTLLQVHENLLSRCLDRPLVQQQFPDFKGTLKSLGAWGGDFLLAATELSFEEVTAYFKQHGLDTVIRYHDIIL